jgi:glucose-1-phosphate thymidylyltransferase
LAQAFIIGKSFIGKDAVCLILGDNIFYGHDLSEIMKKAVRLHEGGLIFGYPVKDPERYGVVEFDSTGRVVGIEEKPKHPKSSYAVVGLYLYDNEVVNIAASLQPSARGELEITDLNLAYLKKGRLRVELLGRGLAWLDTGTHDSMHQAANFVQIIQARQGLKIACIEEIAYRLGYISASALKELASDMTKNHYGQYLLDILQETYGR